MESYIRLNQPVFFHACASAVGYEEARGNFGEFFDYHDDSDRFGAKTWESAEGELSRITLNLALKKGGLGQDDIGLLCAGDLQNQCVASSTGLGQLGIPYLGLYGACSTCGEGLLVASLALNAVSEMRYAAAVTTSHNCAAERQFRLPIEYGGQRTPTAQWTATAGGAFILSRARKPGAPAVTAVMPGRIVDSGISDAANMGAAMAPAVVDSLVRWFRATATTPADYSLVVTGDLGAEGSSLLAELMQAQGYSLGARHQDCGRILYDRETQDAHSGGSGCGCSAALLAAHYLPYLTTGELRDILFLATGALMSPGNIQQGGTISGIAPVIRITRGDCVSGH